MDFLDRLRSRANSAPPLKAGSLSDLAANARDEQWISECVADLSSHRASCATDLLLRALQIADAIVANLESDEGLLAFFAGTLRDILIYESLHFGLHALSDELWRTIPAELLDASTEFSDLARLAACRLGDQHLSGLCTSLHGLDRAQRFLSSSGNFRDMTERLVGVLISVRGRTSIDDSEPSSYSDVDMAIQISLWAIVRSAAHASVHENAVKLSERFDRSRLERDGLRGSLAAAVTPRL